VILRRGNAITFLVAPMSQLDSCGCARQLSRGSACICRLVPSHRRPSVLGILSIFGGRYSCGELCCSSPLPHFTLVLLGKVSVGVRCRQAVVVAVPPIHNSYLSGTAGFEYVGFRNERQTSTSTTRLRSAVSEPFLDLHPRALHDMTGLASKIDEEEISPLAELRLLKSRAQSGERRRQLRREQREAAKKTARQEPDPAAEPKPLQPEKSKSPRKKRNFFKWLFTPSVATSRRVAAPPAKVRVKIPIVYRNGEHNGVVVGGLRVPFSRPMQAHRRTLLLAESDASGGIPEDSEVELVFPDRLAWEPYEAEQRRKNDKKKRLKEEKMARELAK
jgi:hypothetical protein